jgi:hypothetical protein
MYIYYITNEKNSNEDLDCGLLMTALSTTSVTRLISRVLAGDITADKGIPSLSVKIYLFVPSLLLSVGLFPAVITPPKGDFTDIESRDCHVQLIPISLS